MDEKAGRDLLLRQGEGRERGELLPGAANLHQILDACCLLFSSNGVGIKLSTFGFVDDVMRPRTVKANSAYTQHTHNDSSGAALRRSCCLRLPGGCYYVRRTLAGVIICSFYTFT